MNDAKKVSEMQEIYFYESKEHEINKSKLEKLGNKYNELETLCKELVDLYDCNDNIEISVQKIKHHLLYK